MPFDAGRLPQFVSRFTGWSGGNERDAARLIPYFDHVRDDVVLLKDGGVMAMLRMEGLPYHLAANAERNGNARRHFALLQLLADTQTEVVEHLVCHDGVPVFRGADGGSDYWREMSDRYQHRALRGLRQLDWFVSIIVRPKAFSGSWLAGWRRKLAGGDPVVDVQTLRVLAAKVRTARAACRKQNPVRLGTYIIDGVAFSEIGEALSLIATTRRQRVPLAQPAGAFASVLYRDRVVHGPLGFLIERGGGRSRATVGRMIGLNVYPKKPRVGMFDPLLLDQEGTLVGVRWVMTNAARPLSRAQATDKLELTLRRMEKSEGRAISDQEDLEDALDDIASGQEVRAEHGWSLAIHHDDMERLDEAASTLVDMVAGAGCSPAPAGIAGEAMYWSQWPGNRHLCSQPATIGLRRLADLSSLEGHPVGAAGAVADTPRWGAPLLRFATAGNTAYDHAMHDGQIGHTLFCGPSQGGKTVCLGACITAGTALVGERGTIIVLDKDRSNKLTVANNGGAYTELRRGDDSGAAPLKRLQNTTHDRATVVDLILGMIMADGGPPVSERAKARIQQGVAFTMRQPPWRRSIGAVHAWLPPSSIDPADAANRLKPWCQGERLGWAFDGEADRLDLDQRMVGVDITELLEDATVLPVMAAYILHLSGKVMDGKRRVIFVVEEGKFLLPKPEFAKRFEDIILTGRKKNVAFWFVTQQPEHLLAHELGPALLGQMRTRFLFKNEFANRNAYCGGGQWGDGLHATPQEYAQVREGMTAGAWSVLIQRPGKSVLCRFDLSSMPEDLAVLSGTPATVDLWDSIAAKRSEFINRLEEAKA